MIAIIDYGMGNLGSVVNMIKKVGGDTFISSSVEEIEKADKIILPGVGAFDKAITRIKELGLFEFLQEQGAKNTKPVLGICLGMQLLTNGSDEGNLPGLGLIDAYARRFNQPNLIIPHMGWNEVEIVKASKLFPTVKDNRRFYFVHSYAVECRDQNDVLTTTVYGVEFVSSFERDNVIGVQFHPEKSHGFGLDLLNNFVKHY